MVAPAAAQLAEDLHIRNTIEIAMCISIFILGYGEITMCSVRCTF
jgi:hypothetical protein